MNYWYYALFITPVVAGVLAALVVDSRKKARHGPKESLIVGAVFGGLGGLLLPVQLVYVSDLYFNALINNFLLGGLAGGLPILVFPGKRRNGRTGVSYWAYWAGANSYDSGGDGNGGGGDGGGGDGGD